MSSFLFLIYIKVPVISDNQSKVQTLAWPQKNEDTQIKEKNSRSSSSFVHENS